MVTAQHLDNHDIPGFLFKIQGDKKRMKLAAALQMTVLGIPTIYYGDEIGRIGGEWPENRSDMIWEEKKQDRDLFRYYKKLINIRKRHKALSRGKHLPLINGGKINKGLEKKIKKSIYAFLRVDQESNDALFVVINRGKEALECRLPLPREFHGNKSFLEELRGKKFEDVNGELLLNMPPQSVFILSAEK